MKFRRERNLFVGKGIPPRFFEANVPRLFNSYRSNLSHFSNYKLIEPQEFGPFYSTEYQADQSWPNNLQTFRSSPLQFSRVKSVRYLLHGEEFMVRVWSKDGK